MDIDFNLTNTQINKAVAKLRAYSKSLSKKNESFVEALVSKGEQVAETIVSGALDADYSDCSVSNEITHGNGVSEAFVSLNGSDSAFIEFGAGITFSDPQNPLAGENGMGVGTYPGQTRAFNKNGWFYRNGTDLRHSFGHPASAPLYHAEFEMETTAPSTAKSIFKS